MTAGESSCQPGEASAFARSSSPPPLQNLSQSGKASVVVIRHHRADSGAQLEPATQLQVANASFIPVHFFII